MSESDGTHSVSPQTDPQSMVGCSRLILELKPEAGTLEVFLQMLQRGFHVATPVEIPLRQVLLQLPGVSDEYLETRIQTIFLNGKAIDDLDQSIIRDGATVALSAAMPGLVGAMLRKGGALSPLRSSISHCPSHADSGTRHGKIRVKLFNLLLHELGPKILQCGIYMEKDALQGFLESRQEALGDLLSEASWNGRIMGLQEMIASVQGDDGELILLTAWVKPDAAK